MMEQWTTLKYDSEDFNSQYVISNHGVIKNKNSNRTITPRRKGNWEYCVISTYGKRKWIRVSKALNDSGFKNNLDSQLSLGGQSHMFYDMSFNDYTLNKNQIYNLRKLLDKVKEKYFRELKLGIKEGEQHEELQEKGATY